MQEYTTKGTIITEAISTRELEAGTVCLFTKDDIYYRVTIIHINTNGDWVVEGDYNGHLEKERLLYRLSMLSDSACIPIAFKDWNRIIKEDLINAGVQTFTVKPKIFKPGKNVQTCSECYGTFLAAKNQPYCKSCCNKLAVAYLNIEPKQKIAERKYTRDVVTRIANESYIAGKEGVTHSDFIIQLKTKLDAHNLNQKEN